MCHEPVISHSARSLTVSDIGVLQLLSSLDSIEPSGVPLLILAASASIWLSSFKSAAINNCDESSVLAALTEFVV